MANHQKKQQKLGKETLALAIKIFNYQRDLLTDQQITEFENKIMVLKNALEIKPADVGMIAQAVDALEPTLKKHGGSFYPKNFLFENVEMLLVAAILVIGIRTFFFQPFVIPTNSMFPSFNGMTYEIYEGGDQPMLPVRAFNYLVRGLARKQVVAPESGRLKIPFQFQSTFDSSGYSINIPNKRVRGLSRIMLPTQKDEFQLKVNETLINVTVPAEFRFQKVLMDIFFKENSLSEIIAMQYGNIGRVLGNERSGIVWVEVPVDYKKGDVMLNFDIVSGDALFVDRISYHFILPKVGDPIVFKTSNVPGLQDDQEKYYIKRLVGKEGDVLKIQEPVLYRNGQPIDGRPVFEKNNIAEGKYSGYREEGRFVKGAEVTVPEKSYYAMGDNSADSRDSRYWGEVPDKEVLGRALFIYYPFSSHWGLAK
jgi:signal peptidase I